MPNTPEEFQSRRGTALATFAQFGTYSALINLGGLRLTGLYSPSWPGAAGSITFRSAWDASGTGFPVVSEAGALYRITPFGSGTYYEITVGSMLHSAQYVRLEVGTAGTAPGAAGGTIVLVGEA